MQAGTVHDMTVYERPFGRVLEDFQVGDVYRHWPGKTVTEFDDHLFCMITMNPSPAARACCVGMTRDELRLF